MKWSFLIYIVLFSLAYGSDDETCSAGVPVAQLESIELARQVLPMTQDSFAQNCPAHAPYPDLFPQIKNLKSLKKAIGHKLKSLGLEAKWANEAGDGSWKYFENSPQDVARLKKIANITLASLSLYPKNLFKAVKLKKIYFAKDLLVSNQLRKAMPLPSTGSLIYADNNDLECDVGMEERVHHEFFHYIEEKIDGSMRYRDANWTGLNPNGFSYKEGGQIVYSCAGGFRNTGHLKSGFVSRYALTAEEEDKAEMFGWIMTKGFASQVKKWSSEDGLLNNKRSFMIEYFKKIVPSMDEAYFEKFTQE